jgi:biopolymer transport protein ExbB/TolQ
MNRISEWFAKGGPVMWPILALSVLGLAILVWKSLEFRSGRRDPKGLAVVSTIITAEPMLGILGTVTGIMRTFSALNAGGSESPLAATAGIGEALITTAAGLVASLVLLFPYNWLDSMADDETEEEPRKR